VILQIFFTAYPGDQAHLATSASLSLGETGSAERADPDFHRVVRASRMSVGALNMACGGFWFLLVS
jgi:hypothetical protein